VFARGNVESAGNAENAYIAASGKRRAPNVERFPAFNDQHRNLIYFSRRLAFGVTGVSSAQDS
jgi:hypothetical protein